MIAVKDGELLAAVVLADRRVSRRRRRMLSVRHGFTADDVRQEAALAAVRVAGSYRPDRHHGGLVGWAAGAAYYHLGDLCRCGGLVSAGRGVGRYPGAVHLWSESDQHGGIRDSHNVHLPTDDRHPGRWHKSEPARELAERVVALAAAGPDRQLLGWLYLDGLTQAAAARRLGCGPARVSQIVKRVLAEVRDRVSAGDLGC